VGLLTNYTPPLVGTNAAVGYFYDSEREVTQISYPDGQIAGFKYETSGQVAQVALGNGPTLTFQYNHPSLQLTGVTSSAGDALSYGYTGPFRTSVAWSGVITGLFNLQLNANLLPASQSVDGSSVAFAYDADQLLTQAGGLAITRAPATGFITGTSIGAVSDQRQYDDSGLLTNYTVNVNGTSVWSTVYRFDLVGRLTNKVETIAGQTQTFGYIYDAADRLQQVWTNGALGVTYTYDTNGNRLTRNSETATYDAQDRVQTYAASSFTWSPNGTLQSRINGSQTTVYTYDVRGALVSADVAGGEQISYVNDGEARRIGKQVNGALQRGWLWNSNHLAAQVDGNSSLTEQFVYGADDSTPSYMISGTTTYRIFSDERGSVRLVLNTANGAVAEQLDYDEFGRVTLDSNPGFQPFGFAGGLYDPDTGLVQFGSRDYSPETGQWTARDPLRFAGGAFSLYAYVANDPINQIDPSGTGPGPNPLNLPFLGPLNRRADDVDAIITLSQKGNNNQLNNALNNAQDNLNNNLKTAGNLTLLGAKVTYDAPFVASGLATGGVIEEGLVTTAKEDAEGLLDEYEEHQKMLEEQREAKLHGHE